MRKLFYIVPLLFVALVSGAAAQTAGLEAEPARGYFETFLATGAYDEGLAEAESRLAKTPSDPYLLHMKARFLVARGNYPEAEKAFAEAQRRGDFLRNQLEIGDFLVRTGRKSAASQFYGRIAAEYRQNNLKTAESLGIAAQAFASLGDVHEANRVFRLAYEIDPRNIENLCWWATLFREKFNTADAQRTFEEALAINPHSADLITGYARSLKSFAPWAGLAERALTENPNCLDALMLLVEIAILDGDYAVAEETLARALAVNPASETALAHLASVHHLRNEPAAFALVEQQVARTNPRCGEFYLILAENCVRRFLYQDAVSFSQKAISRDPENWRAYALAGSNILRAGKVDLARKYLDITFNQDPFDIEARNTLELIDEYEHFSTRESEHFTLLIHDDERDILARPVLDLAEECYDSLQVRYGYLPAGRIRIEAYNDNDDFAVRISGLPGMGLLGVCFGDVVAFDTPRALADTEYNWSVTLWHELAHVMALGLSGSRVPRWFTEGLSVYEEQRARPQWARQMDLELYAALDQQELLPLADINRGFTRPEFPEQIMLTYYQSAKLVGFIADRHGFEAVTGCLRAFREDNTLDAVFASVLGESPEAVEQAFLKDLQSERDRYAAVLADLPPVAGSPEPGGTFYDRFLGESDNAYANLVREGYASLEDANGDKAENSFLKAIDLFPSYTGARNPYAGLAEAYRRRDAEPQLAATLERFLAVATCGAPEARELAALMEKRGDTARADIYYRRSLEVDPYDAGTHLRLAELYRGQGAYAAETAERRVILALNPVDRATAQYHLGLSLYHERKFPEAKREILRSLELAPGYREAQKLLLECVEGQSGN